MYHPIRSDGELAGRLYRALRRIRRMEERIAEIYPSDRIKSPVHLSIGQESVAVGVCDVLGEADVVAGTYRGHASYLAKGGDPRAMMAELFGKVDGCARGKGGSMHLVDMARNILGCSAVVGTSVPVATGYALAIKRRRQDRVVVAFFGDGASEEGCVYESLNFAALHRLPILFVCENNGYAIHEPLAKRWAADRLTERVATFGIRAERLDTDDVFAVRDAARSCVADLRVGRGPAFLEVRTYRWREHVGQAEDFAAGYRSRDEAAPWVANDPVERVGAMLPPEARAAIDAAVEEEVADCVAFAEASPFPDAAELHAHVYA